MESGLLGRSLVALLPPHAATVPQDDALTTTPVVKSHVKMGGVARMSTPAIRVPHPNFRHRQPVLSAHGRVFVTATARSDAGQAVKDARPTDALEQQVNSNRVGNGVVGVGFLNGKSMNSSTNGTSAFFTDPQVEESDIRAADQNPAAELHTNGAAKSAGTNGAVKERPSEMGLGIAEFLKGKNILLTGATGFLAKGTIQQSKRSHVGGKDQDKNAAISENVSNRLEELAAHTYALLRLPAFFFQFASPKSWTSFMALKD